MIPDPDLTQPTPELPSWGPLPDETARSYLAFARYRDLGPLRTLRRAAGVFYSPTGTETAPSEAQLRQFKTWSGAGHWVARAEAWDLHLDEVSRVRQVEDVKAMNDRQARIGRNLQVQGGITITGDGEERLPATLSVPQALKALELGAKLERTARGEPDTITRREEQVAEADAMDQLRARGKEIIDEVRQARDRRAAGE